jgi:hypothetical protein
VIKLAHSRLIRKRVERHDNAALREPRPGCSVSADRGASSSDALGEVRLTSTADAQPSGAVWRFGSANRDGDALCHKSQFGGKRQNPRSSISLVSTDQPLSTKSIEIQ